MSPNEKKRSPSNQNLTEDVIWGNVHSDDYEDISLAPIDPEEERRRPRQRETMLTVGVVYEEDDSPFIPQFSIRHLIIAQTGIAVLLVAIRLLGIGPGLLPKSLAGLLGIASMIFAALITIYQPDQKQVHFVWWAVFGLYLLTCIFAFVIG